MDPIASFIKFLKNLYKEWQAILYCLSFNMDLYETSLRNILIDPVASFIKFLKNLYKEWQANGS